MQEESPHVPNLSLTQELDDKNDFLKSYLAQQQKSYQEQIEIQQQVMSQSGPQEEPQPPPSEDPALAKTEPAEAATESSQVEETKVTPESAKSDTQAPTEAAEIVKEPPSADEKPASEEKSAPEEKSASEEKSAPEEASAGDIESSTPAPEPVEAVSAPAPDPVPVPVPAPASASEPVENEQEKVDMASNEEPDASIKEPQESIDSSSLIEEKKGEEETSKNDVSSSISKADDSASDNSASKTRPKRKWGSSRTERPQSQGITTSELNTLLPSKEKVSRMASQEEAAAAGEVGSDESASIASSVAKASSETTAANTTFSGKSSGSLADDGIDSSVVATTTEGKAVSEPEKHSLSDSTSPSVSKLSKGQTSPSQQAAEEPADKVQTPPRNAVSCYLFICNLTRPFTLKALQTLLSKFGSISNDNFWIDKIKSKCIVEYDSEENSQEARKELHGLRWPDSNPKTLAVDFSSFDELNQYKLSEQENISSVPAKGSSQETSERMETKPRSVDKYDVVLRSTDDGLNDNESGKRHLREWDRDKVTDELSPKRSRRSPHEKDRGKSLNHFVYCCHS